MNEFSSLIESYPTRLAAALRARDEAAQTIEALDAQVRSVEWRLSAENTGDIQLEHELALLELDYEQMRGEVELSYRRESDKRTEASIAALVRADQRLIDAKRAILDKRYQRDLHSRRVGMMRHSATSPELERLRSELNAADGMYRAAERHLEEMKVSMLSYQILAMFPEKSDVLAQLSDRSEVAA